MQSFVRLIVGMFLLCLVLPCFIRFVVPMHLFLLCLFFFVLIQIHFSVHSACAPCCVGEYSCATYPNLSHCVEPSPSLYLLATKPSPLLYLTHASSSWSLLFLSFSAARTPLICLSRHSAPPQAPSSSCAPTQKGGWRTITVAPSLPLYLAHTSSSWPSLFFDLLAPPSPPAARPSLICLSRHGVPPHQALSSSRAPTQKEGWGQTVTVALSIPRSSIINNLLLFFAPARAQGQG